MAYIDNAQIESSDVVALSTKSSFITFMKRVFWTEFEKNRHQIPKILGIFSFAGQLEKWLEKFMGTNTAKNA